MRTPLTVVLGSVVGFLAGAATTAPTRASQDAQQVLVDGHGRAISSLRPPGEAFTLTITSTPQHTFKVVPAGKKFILTDVMYIAQGSLKQDATVNIGSANVARRSHEILFQVSISPGESDTAHLCSGYVIPAGHSLVAFTNAGLAPEQYVSVAVTGYLSNE